MSFLKRLLCKCGCGKKTQRSKLYPHDWNKFMNGHNTAKTGLYLKTMRDGSKYWIVKRGKDRDKALHRVLIEKALGRKLLKGEVVHHKDHNTLNNQLDNLELTNAAEHNRIHGKVYKMQIAVALKKWRKAVEESRITMKEWGFEILLYQNKAWKVKVLCIQPGHRLSRQYHNRKWETMYYPTGFVRVIPRKKIHRPGNCLGKKVLEIIEVSTNISDDDIVRLADDYNREK